MRSVNPARSQFATATLVQAGRRILPNLVAHAADPNESVTHRVRILKVIEKIGYPSGPRERHAIFEMTYNAPPTVRRAAVLLIKHLRFEAPAENPIEPARVRLAAGRVEWAIFSIPGKDPAHG